VGTPVKFYKIWIAFLMMASAHLPKSGEKSCQEVSGAILTNFFQESGTIVAKRAPKIFFSTPLTMNKESE
jgi:hypothetical protein